jgi:hypothetical protein
MPVRINAIEAALRGRPFAHIGNEVLVAVQPPLADFHANRPVILPTGMARHGASLLHLLPRFVGGAFTLSVSQRPGVVGFALQTPAGLGVADLEREGWARNDRSTLAAAHHRTSLMGNGCQFKDRQTAIDFTDRDLNRKAPTFGHDAAL